jgi:uncharacterized protein YkwD
MKLPDFSWVALGGACLGFMALSLAAPVWAGGFEKAVLAEMNFARTQPFDYAQYLRRRARVGDEYEAQTAPGPTDAADLSEAIEFLEHQKPLPALRADERLAKTAMVHVRAQGGAGTVGHGEADGTTFEVRLHREGVWAGIAGENISYGRETSRGVITQLIIDSGVRGRGHRVNIFDPTFEDAGVACGPHQTYRVMCVIDFAGALAKP